MAAEYALGTLALDERAQAEQLIAADPVFAARVRDWENRLGELAAAVEPVEPPAAVWSNIAAGLAKTVPAAGAPSEAQIIDLTRRLSRWRNMAYAAGALAACLLIFVAVREAYQPRVADSGRFVAVLQQDKASPGFLLTVDLRSKEFTVRRVGADAMRDRSYELWLVHDKFPAPRSLGVIGDREFTKAALSAYDPQIINEATYAVSIEPPGGSPTGRATGPVVYSGRLIEALP